MTPEETYGSVAIQPPEETTWEKERRIRDGILAKVQTDMTTYKIYNENALFRRVVDAVAAGKDAWEIIPLLIEMNDELRLKIDKLLAQWPKGEWPTL